MARAFCSVDRSLSGIAKVTPKDAFAALMEGRTILDLSEGLQLRRVRVMGVNRIELSGFTDTMRQRLTAYGLFHEIISWKLRMFVPTDTAGPTVLERVLGREMLDIGIDGWMADFGEYLPTDVRLFDGTDGMLGMLVMAIADLRMLLRTADVLAQVRAAGGAGEAGD